MNDLRDSEPPSKFDIRFLKNLYEDLSASYEKQAAALASMDKTIEVLSVLLKSFESKNAEQDARLNEYSKRIHSVEMKQASCNAPSEVNGLWHHVKRLNAFMDMKKSKDGISTKAVDTYAQQMQHSMDLAITRDDVSFKVAVLKLLPWAIITIIIAIVLATMVTIQTLTGNKFIPNIPKIESSE